MPYSYSVAYSGSKCIYPLSVRFYLIPFSSKDYVCPPSGPFQDFHQDAYFESKMFPFFRPRQRFLPSRRIFWQGLCLLCPPSVDPVPRFPVDRRRGLTLPAVCPCAAPCKLPSLLLSNLAWLGKGGAGSGIPPSPLSRVKRTLGIRMIPKD